MAEKFSTLCQMFLGRFLKTALYESTGTLLEKKSWKMSEDFLHFFQTSNEKTSAYVKFLFQWGS